MAYGTVFRVRRASRSQCRNRRSRSPRTKAMRALIVDDEGPARAKVRRLLEAAGDVEIVGEATTGREAVAAIKRSNPDLVFLDIQMPGLDGFGVLDADAGDDAPYIVFATATSSTPSAPSRSARPTTCSSRSRPNASSRCSTAPERGCRHPQRPPARRADTRLSFLRRILVIDGGVRCSCPSIRSIASSPIATTSSWSAADRSHVCARPPPSPSGWIRRSSSASTITLVRLDAVRGDARMVARRL